MLTQKEEEKFWAELGKRCEHIPLQQLLGSTEFMGLKFRVTDKVLCPRQDTETLVEEVLRYLQDGSRILDMCTGSGCILLSLLHYSNGCTGIGADLSADALEVAQNNATELGIQAEFVQSDLFEKIEGMFEVIVSNPPYIRTSQIEQLMPEVRDHEPYMALDGHEDGLFFYRKIIPDAYQHLCGGGMLFLEIGFDQGEEVQKLMQDSHFQEVQIVRDLAGQMRVVCGFR
jgi:release factor glutamine methyltransferase